MHTRTDEGHFYSPPLPTSGDKNANQDQTVPEEQTGPEVLKKIHAQLS